MIEYLLTLIRTAKASSGRSLEHSQRGDSGRQKIRANWITGIAACIPTGILHAASVVYLTVPNTVHAAIIDPTYCKNISRTCKRSILSSSSYPERIIPVKVSTRVTRRWEEDQYSHCCKLASVLGIGQLHNEKGS
jgi:hypothetical protein